jgi:Domain of unknown function (DUF6894)
MAAVYFHYSNADGMLMDRGAAAPTDLAEACEFAHAVVRSLITVPGPEDWRGWVLHACDDLGEEIFVLPFTTLLGKPH